ncbi:bacterial type II secretion system protein F domain protein [Clostridium homopropionicum DSM 5847]|uniref:Bacterial type II secretion system protein F domain protein n=1 Tax=Clostridium homopropionicum DSM 5847 TaxID=1121318 RepID=A0A0L6Z8E1_9CLOT|nr:type II secretion system F family protein [Clostridium homopropionicum]KOA19230.1 bacterial type II secretion system protein F domain protein [Clostridium homopropionicum DSM 5847]SFG18167.1 tight adherence protein B [Clostridium homopropionicum]
MVYLLAILIFLLTWCLISAILLFVFNKEKPIDKLKYFDEDYAFSEHYKNSNKSKVSVFKILSTLVPTSRLNKKKNKKLEIELMKADLPVTVEELLVIKILSSSAFAFLAFAVFKDYFIIILVFIAIWNVPRFIIKKKKKDRIKLFDSQLNEGITIISNSLKAGYSFLQAVAVVAEETSDPFSKEFKKLLKEMSFGISEEDALKNLLSRMDSQDLNLMMNAILIQKDIGGNLSEILDNISETIRERQKLKNELKTLTAQGRLSGIILTLIPVFLGLTIYLFNKEYMMLLFTTSIGISLMVGAVVSEFFGLLMIRKITHIDM